MPRYPDGRFAESADELRAGGTASLKRRLPSASVSGFAVTALGGNALLRRGEPLTAENQRRNVRIAARALAPLAREHDLVISHGNGPQVGLLALQGVAYDSEATYPLDILDAET
jgi:hypothetical protein